MSQAFRLHRVSWGEGRFPGVGRATREFWVGGGTGKCRRGVRERAFFLGGVITINFPSILAFCLGSRFFPPSRLPVGWYTRNSTILPVNEVFFKSFFLI